MINEGATKDFRKQMRNDVYGDIQDYNKKVIEYVKKLNVFLDKYGDEEFKKLKVNPKYLTRDSNGVIEFSSRKFPNLSNQILYYLNKKYEKENNRTYFQDASRLNSLESEVRKLYKKANTVSTVMHTDDASRYYDKDFDKKNADPANVNHDYDESRDERRLSQDISQRIKSGYIKEPKITRGAGGERFTGVSYQSEPGELERVNRNKDQSKAERRLSQIERTKFNKAYDLIDKYIQQNKLDVNYYGLGVYGGKWSIDIDYDREGNEKKIKDFINKNLPLKENEFEKDYISAGAHGHKVKPSSFNY